MRQAIDQYTLDKDKPPQSLQDLMNGHYLEEIPMDPFTRKKDWVLEIRQGGELHQASSNYWSDAVF
jgi:general secretion pathway protein G